MCDNVWTLLGAVTSRSDSAIGISWLETKDAIEHSKKQRTAPNDKNYLTHDVTSVEDEKPSFREKEVLPCKYAQGLAGPLGSCLLLSFRKKLWANWPPME